MAIAAAVMLVSGVAACEGGTPPSSARNRDWRQDIAYLERELPVLIGAPPMQPRYGNWETFPLPHSGIIVQYTTKLVNGAGTVWGSPDVTVTPTLAQAMTGADPVLTAALNWVGS